MHQGNVTKVAEDLGVITPEVEALRDRHKIPGMVVLQFDIADPDFQFENIVDEPIDVDRFDLKMPLAGVGQQLLGQIGCFVRRASEPD